MIARRAGSTSTMCVPVGYGSAVCALARDELTRLKAGTAAGLIAVPENVNENPTRVDFCDVGPNDDVGLRCLEQAKNVWEQIQHDAEEAYDRTSACTFTSFIAYEYTAMMGVGRCENAPTVPCWDELDTGSPSKDCPAGGAPLCSGTYPGSGGADNMHRNVIFRNDDVLESADQQPRGARRLRRRRGLRPHRPDRLAAADARGAPRALQRSPGRESALRGALDPAQPEPQWWCDVPDARERSTRPASGARWSRWSRSMQIKGASECRFLSSMPGAWGATDEECSFENMNFSRLNGEWIAPEDRNPDNLPPTAYVRNALKSGIAYEAENGVNPFKLGFVGGLDNHNGTPGQSEEIDYARHGAHGDQSFAVSAQILNEKYLLGLETNGGGLTVAWAEENSRDAIFAALQAARDLRDQRHAADRALLRRPGAPRRHVQRAATSRRAATRAACRWAGRSRRVRTAPRFAVSALMDPGWPNHPGTKLDRVQIIKGWVDASGETHEQVFDVDGRPGDAAGARRARAATRRPRERTGGRPPHLPADRRRALEPLHRLAGSRLRSRASTPSTTRASSSSRAAAGTSTTATRAASTAAADGRVRLDRSRAERQGLHAPATSAAAACARRR